MAGGALRRNGQRPLYQLIGDKAGAERPAARHCWVKAPDGGAPWPGIVVTWVRGPRGWRGRVVYVVPGSGGEDPVLVEAWVEAENLRPVEGRVSGR